MNFLRYYKIISQFKEKTVEYRMREAKFISGIKSCFCENRNLKAHNCWKMIIIIKTTV